LKTLFPQKQFESELHKSNIHGRDAFDNFWLLTTLKGEKDGVMIKQSGRVMTGILHVVPTIRKGLCLQYSQGCLESWISDSKCETRRRICDDLGNNTLVFCWSCNCPVL
jgi:hypothetical protein